MKFSARLKLKATAAFNLKLAKQYSKVKYYKAQRMNEKDYDFIEQQKRLLSTPHTTQVDNVFEYYKRIGNDPDYKSKTGLALKGIFDRACLAARSGKTVKFTNLTKVISSPEILLLAYRSIRGNTGFMTKAGQHSTQEWNKMSLEQKSMAFRNTSLLPDGIALYDFALASKLIRSGKYPWGISRRVYVPKPGVKDKLRPITIPPVFDKIVQKAIGLVLQSIYEPLFEKMNRSFGFRPNKGVHDAIVAICEKGNGFKFALEGDIQAAYDTVNKDKLIKILSKRIQDNKFFELLKQRLNYTYEDVSPEGTTERVTPVLGIPQGGIDSPILFNIVMYEFDCFVQQGLPKYLKLMQKKRTSRRIAKGKKPLAEYSTIFTKLKSRIKSTLAQIRSIKSSLKISKPNVERASALTNRLYLKVKELRLLQHKRRNINSREQSFDILRFMYCRYADDWVLLLKGDINLALKVKQLLSQFLLKRLDLVLSESKTLITNISKNPCKFLGFEITIPKKGAIYKRLRSGITAKYKCKFYTCRKSGVLPRISPDKNRLINRFFMKGFCDRNGFPKELFWISNLESATIIERYNAVIRGFAEFYMGFVPAYTMSRWIYILRYSCIKTLAQKYKTTIRGVFKKFGCDFASKSKQTIKVTKTLEVKHPNGKNETFNKDVKLYTYQKLKVLVESKQRYKTLQEVFWDREPNSRNNGNTLIGGYQKRKGRVTAVTNTDFTSDINWTSLRTKSSFDLPCASCGTLSGVEMHHINHVRKRAFREIPEEQLPLQKLLSLYNRKQTPLCTTCHRKFVHRGKYDGPKLSSLVKLFDNRIIYPESFIKRGKYYSAKSLIAKGWKSANAPS